MRKLLIFSAFFLSIINSLHGQAVKPSLEMLNAAHGGFVLYLTNAVPEETKTIVGFDAGDDLGKAVLGEPLRLYSLSADAIKNFNGLSPVDSIITETDMWYFPIKINDVIKMILYVDKKGDTWTRAGLGSANLAKQLQKIVTQFPSQHGYTPMLIQQHGIGGYLFSIPQSSDENLTETRAVLSGRGFGKTALALKPLNETLADLKNRIPQ